MPCRRWGCAATFVDDTLYVAGGGTGDEQFGAWKRCNDVEALTPGSEHEWTMVAPTKSYACQLAAAHLL